MLRAVIVVVLVLSAAMFLPLGLEARYAAGTFSLTLTAGPVPVRILPRRPVRREVRAADREAESLLRRVPAPLLAMAARSAIRASGHLRGRVRVRRVHLRFTAGGEDPCRAVMAYARAGLAMEGIGRACLGRVRDTALRAEVAFDSPTVFEGDIRLAAWLGTALDAGFCFGFAFLREYYRYKTKREG